MYVGPSIISTSSILQKKETDAKITEEYRALPEVGRAALYPILGSLFFIHVPFRHIPVFQWWPPPQLAVVLLTKQKLLPGALNFADQAIPIQDLPLGETLDRVCQGRLGEKGILCNNKQLWSHIHVHYPDY